MKRFTHACAPSVLIPHDPSGHKKAVPEDGEAFLDCEDRATCPAQTKEPRSRGASGPLCRIRIHRGMLFDALRRRFKRNAHPFAKHFIAIFSKAAPRLQRYLLLAVPFCKPSSHAACKGSVTRLVPSPISPSQFRQSRHAEPKRRVATGLRFGARLRS